MGEMRALSGSALSGGSFAKASARFDDDGAVVPDVDAVAVNTLTVNKLSVKPLHGRLERHHITAVASRANAGPNPQRNVAVRVVGANRMGRGALHAAMVPACVHRVMRANAPRR